MSVKVNIIGAGLAGLSTGIYLQGKGIETEIFEMAPWAGGMCTAWKRNGYRFDGCIHWMVGTRPGDPAYKLYREVDALTGSTKIYNAGVIRMEIDGVMYKVPLTFDAFRDFLLKAGKGDEKWIGAFMKEIRAIMRSELPMGMPGSPGEAVHMLAKSMGFLRLGKKYMGTTVEAYVREVKSGLVKEVIFQLMSREFSAIGLLMMLGTRMSGNAGYPLEGAEGVTRRMVEKYKGLGGKLTLNARVEKIVVEGGAAKGVVVKGTPYPSDYVVAACDAYDTLANMLEGKYPHPQIDGLLKNAPLFHPLALVSFGLDKHFDIPFAVTYECREGIKTSPDTVGHSFSLRSFDFDKSAAPRGGSSVMAMIGAPLAYWQNLRESDMAQYKKEKQNLADAIAEAVEERLPGFRAAIRVTDVSTPATYVRLTNVYRGSFEGFAPVPASLKMRIAKTLPGLERFYMCGQWTTAGGGICTAVSDGKQAAHKILKEIK